MNRYKTIATLFTVLFVVAAHADTQLKLTPFAKVRAAVAQACKSFTPCDRNGDGINEINTLKLVDTSSGTRKGVVVVLVEKRLWEQAAGPGQSLRPSLKTYLGDLGRDGYSAFLVVSSIYDGPIHQDGETVLAIRDLLKTIRLDAPDLRAIIMVGNYPSAFLVRQYYWQRDDGITILGGTKAERKWDAVPHVRSIAEAVAKPCDLVLADLDGHWENMYRRVPEHIAGLLAAFPDDPKRETTDAYQYTAEKYEDFFFVNDGYWEETPAHGGRKKFTFKGEPNEEVSDADRQQVNIIARPEIAVGRINAIHAALEPNRAIKGVDGKTLLDANGKPHTVEFGTAAEVPAPDKLWVPSETLERKLLVAYFDRNHRYRTGGYPIDRMLPASIASEWESSVPEMKQAVAGWATANTAELDLNGGKLTNVDFVEWMKRPALCRAIKAHANPWAFYYGAPADMKTLDAEAGPAIWSWVREGNKYVPTLRNSGGGIGFYLLRTMYENKLLPDCPVFYFHTGCESIMPGNYETQPYNSPNYGQYQLAESLLMYGNGLALVARGKVFYDEPREFWKVLGNGGTWGDAWKHYFDVEGADANLAKDGIGRTRSSFWSCIGDVTLSLPADLVRK